MNNILIRHLGVIFLTFIPTLCLAIAPRPLVIELISGEKIVKSPSLIDSITFDIKSIDSLGIPLPIQKIWEGGQSTDIFISEIADASFKEVPTVLCNDVILLEGEIYNSLVSIENDTILYFKEDIRNYFRPTKGLKLATLHLSDKLPMGFMGKIEEVDNENGKCRLKCSRCWFTDIYESFYGEFQNRQASSKQKVKRRAMEVSEENIELSEIKGVIDFSPDGKLEESEFFGATGKVEISQKSALSARTAVLVEPGARMSVSSIITIDNHLEEELSLCHRANYSKEIPIIESSVKIPIAPLLQVYFSGGIHFDVNGSIGIKASAEQDYKVLTRVYLSNYDNDAGDHNLYFIPQSNTIKDIEAFGNVEMKLGIYGELGVAILKPGVADIGFKYENGLQYKMNAPITKNALENASRSTDLYDLLAKNDNITLSRYSGFAISSDLLKNEFWKLYLNRETDTPFLRASLLPTFSRFAFNRKNEAGRLQLEGMMKSSLFRGIPKIAAFENNADGSRASEAAVKEDFEVIGSDIGNSKVINTTILSKCDYIDKKWTLYPCLNLYGFEVLANPAIELDEAHVKASNFNLIYKNIVKSCDSKMKPIITDEYKFMADVEIDKIDVSSIPDFNKDSEWGIYVYLDEYPSHINYYIGDSANMKFIPLNDWKTGEQLIAHDIIFDGSFSLVGDLINIKAYLNWGYYCVSDNESYFKQIHPQESAIPVETYVAPLLDFTSASTTRKGDIYEVKFRGKSRAVYIFSDGFSPFIFPSYVYNWNHRGGNYYFVEPDDYIPTNPTGFVEVDGYFDKEYYATYDGDFEGSFRVSGKGCFLEHECDETPKGINQNEYYRDTKYSTTSIDKNKLTVVICVDMLNIGNSSEIDRLTRSINGEHIYFELGQRVKTYYNKVTGTTTHSILSDNNFVEIRRRICPIVWHIVGNHVEHVYVSK